MCTAWGFLLWGDWAFFEMFFTGDQKTPKVCASREHARRAFVRQFSSKRSLRSRRLPRPGDVMFGRMVFACISTVVCLMTLVGLSFWAQQHDPEDQDQGVKKGWGSRRHIQRGLEGPGSLCARPIE